MNQKGKKETEGSSKVREERAQERRGTEGRTSLQRQMQATGVGVILGIVPSNPPVFYLAADPTVATAALAGHLFVVSFQFGF